MWLHLHAGQRHVRSAPHGTSLSLAAGDAPAVMSMRTPSQWRVACRGVGYGERDLVYWRIKSYASMRRSSAHTWMHETKSTGRIGHVHGERRCRIRCCVEKHVDPGSSSLQHGDLFELAAQQCGMT